MLEAGGRAGWAGEGAGSKGRMRRLPRTIELAVFPTSAAACRSVSPARCAWASLSLGEPAAVVSVSKSTFRKIDAAQLNFVLTFFAALTAGRLVTIPHKLSCAGPFAASTATLRDIGQRGD